MKKIIMGILLLLALSIVVIAEINILQVKKSSVNVSTWIHKSHAIQDADRASIIAQKTKIRKNAPKMKTATKAEISPEKAPEMLTEIDRKKMEHYKTINGALLLQQTVYEEMAKGDGKSSSSDRLKTEIGAAQGALQELKKLTEKQIGIYKGTTNDAQAIKTAWSTYYTWESAVKGLSPEPLEDARIAEIDGKIASESNSGISASDSQLKEINAADLDSGDKDILKNEIVPSGRDVFSGVQAVMTQMQSIMQDFMKQMQGGSSSGGIPVIGNLFGGGKKSESGPTPFSPEAIQALQKSFEALAAQMQSFMGSFGPFMQTAGSLVGESVTAPTLAMPTFKP